MSLLHDLITKTLNGGSGGGGSVTAESIVTATGQMTPAQQSQTRANIGATDASTSIPDNVKAAFLNCFDHVAWADDQGQTYVDALEAALYSLDHIMAVYTQSGTVYDTDSLDSLKADLVVTVFYQGGGSKAVTGYTLSGTLEVGTSTITVSYGGKTTTFSVSVTHYVEVQNYVVVGNPTIENNILTVTDGNFIKTPDVFSPDNNTWKVTCKHKLSGEAYPNYIDIFGSVDSSNASARGFLFEASYHGCSYASFISSNNISWDITSTLGGLNLPIDQLQWVWTELSFDGSQYTFKYSTDGTNFTSYNVSSTSKVYGGFAVAFGLKRNGYLPGQIDLSECKILINDQLWWQAIG